MKFLFLCRLFQGESASSKPIDTLIYPEIDEATFCSMRRDVGNGRLNIFAYVRANTFGEDYIDLYYYNMSSNSSHKRFILQENKKLSENEEVLFLYIIRDNKLYIDDENMCHLCMEVNKAFPGIHFTNYKANEISVALEHIYFSFIKQGPYEILYKANLERIAYNVFQLDINLIGKSPVELFDGLPINFLRMINQSDEFLLRWISSDRQRWKVVYEEYRAFLDSIPDEIQWEYLLQLYEFRNEGLEFRLKIYRLLKGTNCVYVSKYIKYCRNEKICSIKKRDVPKISEIDNVLHKQDITIQLLRKEKYFDKLIQRYKNDFYEYSYAEFMIFLPDGINAIIEESIEQENCLLDYVIPVVEGSTRILFMRKKISKQKSYITIEIKDNTILQAYGKNNRVLDTHELSFLEIYAGIKGINFNPLDIYKENEISGIKLFNTYYKEFMERHKMCIIMDQNHVEYRQLTLWECFPKECAH
ncbi:MAG: PcfJ domain-containing protein [Lachnospiraceae bacterium]|nr:PcfJ domain-containing protein [Lachnospiraceae bacterium]